MEFLDASRGLAAFAVVLQHSLEVSVPGYFGWSLHTFSFGTFGVVVFFLVSGFIIPVSLERSNSLKIFWLHRAFRLYPMYWVSLFVTVALSRLGYFPIPQLKIVIINITLLQSFLHTPDLLGVYWTLSIELVFYALCSLLFALGVHRLSVKWSLLASGGLSLLTILGGALHRSFPAGRLGLLVTSFAGTVIYRFYAKQADRRSLAAVLAVVAGSLVIGFWFRFYLYPAVSEIDAYRFGAVVLTWGVAYCFFGLLFVMRRRQFPGWMLYLGRISYSLYLVHGLVVHSLPMLSAWIFVPTVLTLSVLISSTTYHAIERPTMKLAHLLGGTIRPIAETRPGALR